MRTEIMGILNINKDSFFSGSRVAEHEIKMRIEKMLQDGADMIDIGAVSSRPGSEKISEDDELERLKNVCDIVKKHKFYEKAVFSLDSYSPLCLDYAFSCGFKIANDITGAENSDVCKVVKKHNASIIIMHMKGNPKEMQNNPTYEDVVKEVDIFFSERSEKAKSFSIKNIILDVGIGFGKTLEHNIALIKEHSKFLHFGYPLLIGASRKTMIGQIYPSKPEERLSGTLIVHMEAVRNGASIIRCHDVKEHCQAVSVFEALR